jgi:hypothetical protein
MDELVGAEDAGERDSMDEEEEEEADRGEEAVGEAKLGADVVDADAAAGRAGALVEEGRCEARWLVRCVGRCVLGPGANVGVDIGGADERAEDGAAKRVESGRPG